jgi:hypothetical protein
VVIEDKHAKKNVIADKNISILNAISGNRGNLKNSEKSDPEIEEEVNSDPEAIFENDFTQEELELKWKIFADMVQTDRPRIAVSMKTKIPKLEPGFIIQMIFENSDLREDFNNFVKPKLVTFLRKELLNNSLTLNVLLEENGNNGKKMIYTPEEKYMYLSRKNPLLEKLKQQLNLELE